RGGQSRAVRTERHVTNLVRVSLESEEILLEGVPDPHRVVLTRGGQPSAVRAVCYDEGTLCMSLESKEDVAGVGVPDPQRLVRTPGGDPGPVRAEHHAVYRFIHVSLKDEERLAGGGVPDPHRTVRTRGGQSSAVRAERHAVSTLLVSLES